LAEEVVGSGASLSSEQELGGTYLRYFTNPVSSLTAMKVVSGAFSLTE
jgi:hypothetical protein